MALRSGHAKRKRDMDEIVRGERLRAVKEHVVAETAALDEEAPLEEFTHVPEESDVVESSAWA